MTRGEFCSLVRGDIVTVAGNGLCVVEAVSSQSGLIMIDLRFQRGALGVVRDIPETEAEIIGQVFTRTR